MLVSAVVQVLADGGVLAGGGGEVELVGAGRLSSWLSVRQPAQVVVFMQPAARVELVEAVRSIVGGSALVRRGTWCAVDSATGSSLAWAASASDAELVAEVLGWGGSTRDRDVYGRTALHHAALGGSRECVELVLQAGAEVDAVDTVGSTPCQLAAAVGEWEVVQALLHAGADRHRRGLDPVGAAAAGGNLVCHRLLAAAPAPRWAGGSWVRLHAGRRCVVVDGRSVGVGGRLAGHIVSLRVVESASIRTGVVVLETGGRALEVPVRVRTPRGDDGCALLCSGLGGLNRSVCDDALAQVLDLLVCGDGGPGRAGRRLLELSH